MRLSIIIPCFNAALTLGFQLQALADQNWTKPWEVIVADNGSTDTSLEVVRQYRQIMPNLRSIDASQKRGAAHARNAGAKAAAGELLAFCDADDVVAPGWIAAVGDALSEHDFIASRFDVQSLNPSWLRKIHRNTQGEGLARVSYFPYLPHAGGCGLGIKHALHDAVGGFDESLSCLEDTDYCFKVQMADTSLRFIPQALIYIRCRSTLFGLYCQSRFWAEHNVLLSVRYASKTQTTTRDTWRDSVTRRKLFKQAIKSHREGDLARLVWKIGWQKGLRRGVRRYVTTPMPGRAASISQGIQTLQRRH